MTAASERWISVGPDCAPMPERLLLAHARGQVLFITGAGVSAPAGLPDFRQLVLDVYQRLDPDTHTVLVPLRRGDAEEPAASKRLPAKQRAEVQRFLKGDFDVVLGMLERRLEGDPTVRSIVRTAVAERLRTTTKPSPLHRALYRLSDRGGATALITTNFDCLLERAAGRGANVETYALGGIPRPSARPDFSGVFHIHGALAASPERTSDVVLTDHDFGEFYLRRRIVPDFIYDAARLYHLVLVGYTANDPPMRYLLNAVAADGTRFSDLKERFTFFSGPARPDDVALEDWRGRGITPIPYDDVSNHAQLLTTLGRWAELSPHNGDLSLVPRLIGTTVRQPRDLVDDAERDLFDHLIRRSTPNERVRLAALASAKGADLGWLKAIADVSLEPRGDV